MPQPGSHPPGHLDVRVLLETALDCVIVMDKHGVVIEFNHAAVETFGYSHGEAVGQELGQLIIPHELRDAHKKGLEHYLSTGEGPVIGQRLNLTGLRKDGTTFPLEIAITASGSHDSNPIFTAYLRDTTERQRADDAIQAALAQAKAANKAKDEFLANMSHEIRTPLTAILGYADMICDRLADDPDISEWAQVVRTNGQHLDHILADMLDITRIESNKIDLATEEYTPGALLQFLFLTFNELAKSKGIALSLECEGTVPESFEVDPGRLRQILINLVSNSLKYTVQGSVRVVLSAAPGDSVAILSFSVEDTGVGIAPDEIDKVKDRYYRSKSTSADGTGLGLSIASRLVQLLDGELSIESEHGKGTIVRFTLPVKSSGQWRNVALDTLQEEQAEPLPNSILSGKALIVEDSVDLATLCASWLVSWGLTCDLSHDGFAGLDAALAGDYDLILMDWRLPGRDGMSVVRELRDRGIEAPIIAVTAHAGPEARKQCLDAGSSEFITKPIDPSQLRKLLDRLLEPAKAEPTAPKTNFETLQAKYILTLRDEYQQLQAARDANDIQVLRRVAHRIKGTAGSFRLPEVSAVAASIEKLESTGPALDTLLEEFRDAIPGT